jgi:hypothetical protein
MGGVNTVAMTNVVTQASGPLPLTPIPLAPGQWIRVAYATAPSAVWVAQ